ncbi:MAG: hypothetical protein WCC94_03280 [Candidatus Bathyarchaeia archaeon]
MEFQETWTLPECELSRGDSMEICAERLAGALVLGGRPVNPVSVLTASRGKKMPGVTAVHLVSAPRDSECRTSGGEAQVYWADVQHLPTMLGAYESHISTALTQLSRSPRDVAILIQSPYFTITELREAMDVIRGLVGVDRPIDKRNFRRQLDQVDWLFDTGRMSNNVAFRPAKLYQVASVNSESNER